MREKLKIKLFETSNCRLPSAGAHSRRPPGHVRLSVYDVCKYHVEK